MFMKYSAKLSPEKRKEWKEKFSNKGLFELKEQTAQVRRSQTLFTFSEYLYGAVWKYALFGESPSCQMPS